MGVTQIMHGARPARTRHLGGLASQFVVLAVFAILDTAHARASSGDGCFDRLSDGYLSPQAEWRQRGSTVERRDIPPEFRGRPLLVRVEDEGVNVAVQILDARDAPVAQSDSPVERSGAQYLFIPAGTDGLTLVATADEPAGVKGLVRVTFLSPDTLAVDAGGRDCSAALHKWADGDMAYARGRAVTSGRVSADKGAARAGFDAASSAYQAARKALEGSQHASERGQLELALAALSYYGLKDWSGSESWAKGAASTFAETHEPYRQARAEAIEAAAWIELATKSA